MSLQVKRVLEEAVKILKDNNIDEAIIKAKIVLCMVLKIEKEYIIINDSKEMAKEDEEKYFQYINKLKNGIPLQYITNNQEFMKLNFFVDENVLIPRADTEILVEEVISLANDDKNKILDVCTGSGAIAVSLAKYIKNSNVMAIDISKEALKIAEKNAFNNNVNIKFIESDLFNNLEENDFDIIVSNPPYIRENVINELSIEVKHEPKIALDGGKDGLDFYRKLSSESDKYLREDGYLCLEIGYDQKNEVIEILKNEKKYKNIYSKKDLFGNDRIIIAQKVGEWNVFFIWCKRRIK
mgnify:FL=1